MPRASSPDAAPSAKSRRPTFAFIGIDTGGTFTDFVCFEAGRLRVHKVPSTPDDPSRAVLHGLRDLLSGSEAPAAVDITYGSTVATNALLERRGARVVLLTTAGFEDLLEIARQTRPDIYALEPRKPEPLLDRRHRLGVVERMTFDGRVLVPLSRMAVKAARAAVERLRAESVAVCFLHSYADARHERAIGRAVRDLGIPCSLSHELVAEYREYERLSTTVINAYVAPVMRRHLSALRRGVGGARLRVMQSNGGAVSVETAGREAVRTLLSGPAAGVVGAVAAARRVGAGRIITFDMGGTSTDVSLIDGEIRRHTEWTIADLPVKVPAIDIHTVGAGGGSLARRDAGGVLKVGPQSAGADPGPACYGRGREPTVTDANVVLGRLIPDAFLGGRMTLDAGRARTALSRLAADLGLSMLAAAEGVVRVVNAEMERAIRRISVERGHDPRDYTLVAFGGAGGLHVCELAAEIGIRRVLLPVQPGLLSAWGALSAELQRDYVQTVRLVDADPHQLEERLGALRARARADLRAEGAAPQRVRIDALVDVRYRGQSYEIPLPMTKQYVRAFHAAHRRLYGYADEDRSVEVVNVRVVASVPSTMRPRPRADRRRQAPRPHRFRWQGRWLSSRVCDRDSLPIGRRVSGPLLLTEFSATAVVPPGWSIVRTRQGDLVVEGKG